LAVSVVSSVTVVTVVSVVSLGGDILAELKQEDLEHWIQTKATGVFYYKDVIDGRVAKDPRMWAYVRVMLFRCKDKGIAFPVNGRDGYWRPSDTSLEEVFWWGLNGKIGENLLLPLGLLKYCYIPRPSLVLVAGIYNAGKTALCINIVNHNLEKWANNIFFFVSENAEMMKAKFDALNSYIPSPPPFKTYRRTENFADVIQPDGLNVIDYLRVDMDKPYAISSALFQIYNKLKTGIAVVAMQKPPGRKLAFGGAATAFEPALYLSMDKGYIEFEKIKIPRKLDYDPYSIRITFRIRKGVDFYEIHEEVG